MLSLLLLSPIWLPSSFSKAFVTSKVTSWKYGQSVSGAAFEKKLQRYPKKIMSAHSEWIVSSLSEEIGGSEDAAHSAVPTHLFLHFDINETVLLGDDAGGDSRHESTQKMLAKSAFCRIPESSTLSWEKTRELKPTHWWDGQEIGKETSIPPLYTGWKWPEKCCPYYRTAYKRHAKSFTESGNHGQIYEPVLEACEALLPSKNSIRSRNCRDADDLSPKDDKNQHNIILPAFYETLCHLIESYHKTSQTNESEKSKAPPFTVVFRTFGSDLPEIASVVTAFAEGKHPDYPDINFPPMCLPEDRLYQGRWKVVENTDDNVGDDDEGKTGVVEEKLVYQLWTSDETQLVASGDAEILELLSGNSKASKDESSAPFSIFGIRDDYPSWKAHKFHPTTGKPIWVPRYDGETDANDRCVPYSHHLLFDDNIHNLPNDGIACVRKEVRADESGGKNRTFSFETVDGADMDSYQGIHLVRVPTVEPVLNPQWYIQQIEKARKNLQSKLK